MLQHNPHRRSVHCHGLGVTLDGYATRELSAEDAARVPCLECDCRLSTEPAPAKAKPAAKRA